jgi:hypothetical protein
MKLYLNKLSMRIHYNKIFLAIIFINVSLSVFSQDNFKKTSRISTVIDSLRKAGINLGVDKKKPEITLSTSEAIEYLQKRTRPQLWHNAQDPLRQAFGQLILEAVNPPLDSIKYTLSKYPYDSLSVPWDKFYIWEPLKIKIPDFSQKADSAIIEQRAELNLNDSVTVPSAVRAQELTVQLKDTTFMVIIDSLSQVPAPRPGFPFKYATYPFQGDSIQAAVRTLLDFIEKRDSSTVNITGIGKSVTPITINSQRDNMVRYWLKNEFSDSVAVWIGNPSRNTIGLYLEHGVNFKRPSRQGDYGSAKINLERVDTKTLLSLQNAQVKTNPWKFRTEASYVLNQSAMSNWVKGGEGSVSTALDITGYAEYKDKEKKISSASFARLKFGYIANKQDGLKKNLDLLETNSKLNHLAFGKVDFSAIMLFKTQVAIGKNYFTTSDGRDSSDIVSKFMNPATLTVGLGLDYKPNKKTSINLSPLSYKGTFVTDTALIDQTLYGVPNNKKARNEPGASFMISHEFNPMKTVTVINRLQLFTNYINNPQNVDFDWEMIAVARLNWFTDVRFNTHLIFDDDTKTFKKGDEGSDKKTARVQFKEMLGFSVSFRF